MSRIKKALIATGIALLAVIAGGVGGFLAKIYLEIWFEPVDELKLTDLSTWPNIARGISAKLDVTKPQRYRAYYGENFGDLKTEISVAHLVLRDFQITGKIVGSKTKEGKAADTTNYSLAGYLNPKHMVLTQRGSLGGVGVFFLQNAYDINSQVLYFGYFLTEDLKKPGGADEWVTQCPFVMMSESVAKQYYPTADAAKNALAFLQTKCIEFKLPSSIGERIDPK